MKDAELEESEDEFDLSKIKQEGNLEVDETFDTNQLLALVAENTNEDVEQLERIEKEIEDDQLLANDDELMKFITRKAAHFSSNIVIKDFEYDRKKFLWCCIKFEVPIKFRNIDVTNLLRDTARTAVIWQIPKIKRAITFKQNDILSIKTEGINIEVRYKMNFF
jgi:hypothetical protein